MSYLLEIIGHIGIYAILAMSLNAICGLTGLLQLGHAGFFAVGAYSAGLVSVYCFVPQLGWFNFGIGAGVAMVMAAFFALLIGMPCLRLSGDYLAIATLGFGEIVRLSLNNIMFPGCAFTDGVPFGGPTGIELPLAAEFGSWWFIWVWAAITYVLLMNVKYSALGRAFLAIREDEIAARSMGVNVSRYKILSFVLCAVFAGLAGALFAYSQLSLSPGDFSLLRTIEILLMVVLGGLGSFSGSLLGAVLLVGIPELLRFVPRIGGAHGFALAEYRQLVFAALLILLIRLVPNGLLGMRELVPWGRLYQRGKDTP